MNYVQFFIVQDLETFEFLCPDPNGDIGQTPYLKGAGRYETREDAFSAGTEECGGQFSVTSFFEVEKKK